MTRWLRFLLILLRASLSRKARAGLEGHLGLRVWPTECDASFMNHAALLSVMECGRVDLMARSGFFALARARGWYVPLISVTVRYLRPLRRFERFELRTKILFWDETALWMEHLVESQGRRVAVALVKGAVRQGRENVPFADILAALEIEATLPPRPAWHEKSIALEQDLT